MVKSILVFAGESDTDPKGGRMVGFLTGLTIAFFAKLGFLLSLGAVTLGVINRNAMPLCLLAAVFIFWFSVCRATPRYRARARQRRVAALQQAAHS